MDSCEKFYIIIISIIVAGVILFAASIDFFYSKRMISYVENGYCETTVAGYAGTVIQRCK